MKNEIHHRGEVAKWHSGAVAKWHRELRVLLLNFNTPYLRNGIKRLSL